MCLLIGLLAFVGFILFLYAQEWVFDTCKEAYIQRSPTELQKRRERETRRQMGRIDLNERRIAAGMDPFFDPRGIEFFIRGREKLKAQGKDIYGEWNRGQQMAGHDLPPPEEQKVILQCKDLWPEAPDGFGGVWFNEPYMAERPRIPGRLYPGVMSEAEMIRHRI